MPYKLSENGLQVLKEDGTPVGKEHKTKEEARAHLAALEANVEDAKHLKIGAAISAANMKKVQAAHDAMVEMGAACGTGEKSLSSVKMASMMEMGGAEYAIHEGWDIQQCCSVISQLASMCQSECNEGEMDEAMVLCRVMMQLMDHCKTECQDMMDGMMQEQAAGKSFAVPKDWNVSYVKSLGVVQNANQLAVKFVGKDQIKGYTFLWGSPELTDVEIEYFTKATNFWDPILSKNPRPLTWDHAQDKDFKASPIIGEITDFGDDDLGRWYVAKLNVAHQYNKAIVKLINQGVLGTSSDSAPQYVVREQTGKSTWLKEWPWFASALTNTPAEPRMIGSLEFLKSLGVQLPDVDVIHQRYEHLKRQSELLKLKGR